jgi:hypothetical protein
MCQCRVQSWVLLTEHFQTLFTLLDTEVTIPQNVSVPLSVIGSSDRALSDPVYLFRHWRDNTSKCVSAASNHGFFWPRTFMTLFTVIVPQNMSVPLSFASSKFINHTHPSIRRPLGSVMKRQVRCRPGDLAETLLLWRVCLSTQWQFVTDGKPVSSVLINKYITFLFSKRKRKKKKHRTLDVSYNERELFRYTVECIFMIR